MLRVPWLRCSLLILATGVTLVLAACGKTDSQQAAAPIPVSTLELTAKQVPYVVEIVGRTEGSKEVEVRARVSGILEQRLYSEGSAVQVGKFLFRIDKVPYEIALERAKAALSSEQARNGTAHRNAERLNELLTKNLVSQNDVDNAQSAMHTSDSAVRTAQINIREAELNLSYTDVVAPISGITGRALRSDGSLVAAGTDSGLLTTMTQANPIWVRFALSGAEHDALRAATKSTADLTVDLMGNDGDVIRQDGHVNFAASTVDANLGTVQLRAEFANPKLDLLPGGYVRVRLTGGVQNTITVPQTALLQGAKGPFVWVMNAQQQVEQRAVKTGAWVGDEWRITEGLAPGDVIVLDNLLKLKSGQMVKAQAAGAPPAQAPVAKSGS